MALHSENDRSVHGSEQAHVNNVRIDLGGTTLLVVVVLVAIIGVCGVVMGLNLAKQSQMDLDFRDERTQYKLLERRDMDMEAYFEVNGLKVPGDTENGPTGNLRRMKPQH